jgi:lysophospholipase L1-like esterase
MRKQTILFLIFILMGTVRALFGQVAATTEKVGSVPSPSVSIDEKGLVTLTAESGLSIGYSLDKSEPDARAGRYLAPIDVSKGAAIRARAFSADRKLMSSLVTARFDPVTGAKPAPTTVIPVTQDRSWPQYEWEKRHQERCQEIQTKKPRLIFIGDSITHFFNESIWNKNFGPERAVNLGYGWDRTENVLWRLMHGEIEGISPKVVVVMIGTNNLGVNTNSEIVQGITAICKELHSRLPESKILLLGIFPRGEKPNELRDRIQAINKEIAKLLGHDGVTFADFGSKFLESDRSMSRTIMADYLHPTQKGYEIWAEQMLPILHRLMK